MHSCRLRSTFINRQSIRLSSSTISSAYEKALETQQELFALKQAELKMIDAELANSDDQQDTEAFKHLQQERLEISRQLTGKNFYPADKEREYHAGKMEAVKVPRFSEMNSLEFQRNHGPKLLHRMATYYRLFDDAFPKEWKSSAFKEHKMLNLTVDFAGDSDPNCTAARGNLIMAESTLSVPKMNLSAESVDKSALFTFMALNVDTPMPSERTMIASPFYMVSNATVNDDNIVDSQKGDVILSYVPPHPQKGTGFHRYVWLALQQSSKISPEKVFKQLEQTQWDAKKFLQQSEMTPCGCVFHRAAWTPAVSDLYDQGQISEPLCVAKSSLYTPSAPTNTETLSVDEYWRVKIDKEPVYGKTVDRDWEHVVKRLYKYAFK